MRPVRLEFAGLQSYREKQVLDFTDLLGGGLFGIFGPTGSGKSTILDAITLALYGRVGRADRGTMGIMNQSENRLWVKFSFALGHEGEYRVERSYKREKETASIRSEHARLVHVTPAGETVLADREREVTQRMTELLGLQLEDFTRAVVLPQGQFAEFLKLSGRDRTQMLQRIFSLTQYGDGLNQRLKRRVEAVNGQLIAVQSEQVGLGDASSEAVDQAEQALQQAEVDLAAADQDLAGVEEQVKGWERVWELQQELEQVNQGLERWQAEGAIAEGWRAELAAARRAEGVRPHLEAKDLAQIQAAQAQERLGGVERALAVARAGLAEAVAAHEAARRRRVNEGPGLARRQGELQRAVQLEAGLVEAKKLADDLEGRVTKGQALCAEVARKLVTGEGERQGLLTREAQLRQQLVAVDVPGEERARVSEAGRRLDRLQEAERTLRDLERRLAQRQEHLSLARREAERIEAVRAVAQARLQEFEEQVARLEAEPPADEAELRAQEAWLGRAGEQIRVVAQLLEQVERRRQEYKVRVAEAAEVGTQVEAAAAEEAGLRRSLATLREERDSARTAVEAVRRQAHAAALVAALEPGGPCPVCGSLDHPHPASLEEAADLAAAEAALARAEEALRQAELALERGLQQRMATEGRSAAAAERAAEGEMALAQAEQELRAARERLPESWQGLGAAELEQALTQEGAEQEQRKARHQAWQTQLLALRKQREEQAGITASAASEASAQLATAKAVEQSLKEAESEREAQEGATTVRRAEFDQVRGEMDASGVEAAQRRIEEADKKAQSLRQTLDELRKAEQDQQQLLADLRKKEQEYTQLLHQRQVELAQARQRQEEVEGEWSRLTGGKPAAPQLAAVDTALSQLEEAEATTAALREAAEGRGRQAEAAHAGAQREAELAVKRAEESATTLAHALVEAGFADGDSARAALRPQRKQVELEGQIKGYEQEGDRLQTRQTALLGQLAGRSLTPEAWQQWRDRLGEARATAVARREERARAMQIRDDLLAKQRRWQELEEQRAALSTQMNHLEELRSLLRGNAFVDFLAEEQMGRVAAEASLRLGQLTRYRYALETETGGGFVVRDDSNGGACRSVSTLSGGETFLASLALALALSAQIQLRGHFPLEFFFLDEGFGTLDPDLLDLVISTLERLHFESLHVGVISHVPELRSRLQRRVIVEAAEAGGRGSRFVLERA